MRKRAPATYNAKTDTWHVDLPTYSIIPGTWQPITPDLIGDNGVHPTASPAKVLAKHPTVEVEIPDEWPLTADGQIDAERLRIMYRGHPRFGSDDFTPPKLEPA